MLRNYIRIAFRNLRRQRAYTFINVCGLALSMTCGILIFSLVNYHLGFDRFHTHSDRIYRVVTEQHRDNVSYVASVPAPLGKLFRNDFDYAEKLARIVTIPEALVTIDRGGAKEKFKELEGCAFAEPAFFDIFNYPLLRGDQKTMLTEPNTAIITEKMAKKYFGNDDPINKTFRLNNLVDFKVIGLLKDLPEATDRRAQIYLSYSNLKSYDEWIASDDSWGGILTDLQCFLRLRPGVSTSMVENAMDGYVKKYRSQSKNIHHYKLQPLADIHFNPLYGGVVQKRILWVLSFIALFLIATACVNFVNLATAQALRRSKEVGVRKVLGSGRSQIFWQFIFETGAITLMAALLSIGASYLSIPYINSLFNAQIKTTVLQNGAVWMFVLILLVLVTFLAGIYPGLILAGFKPILAIKGKISQQHVGGFNMRRSLIVAQFVISQLLLIGMIVVGSQMKFAKNADLGFVKDAIVMLPVPSDNQPTMRALKDRMVALPGVQSVSICSTAPLANNGWTTSFRFDRGAEDENFSVSVLSSDKQYVSTFGLKLVAGKNFTTTDSAKEFLVNETFVKKLNLSSAEQVLGKTLSMNRDEIKGEIVGVVKDFHDRSFHADISPVCISSFIPNYSYFATKINMASAGPTLAALEKAWNSAYPEQLYEYHFLEEQLEAFYKTEELMLTMISLFSFVAIFIGCLGLYGLVSFMVAQKTREIGIRKVLGGNLSDILWIFGKEFFRLILLALLVAAPIGWWIMSRWLEDYKFRISLGPGVILWTLLVSFAIVLVAGGFQSLKAATANPVKSLKME